MVKAFLLDLNQCPFGEDTDHLTGNLRRRGAGFAAGIAIGADDFLTKPIDQEELALRLRNNLRSKEFHDFLAEHKQLLEEQVAERTRVLREGYIDTIHRLVLASEFKDEYTGAHINRISHYTREIAETCDLDSEFAEHIFYASPMHDIGKLRYLIRFNRNRVR